MQATFPIGPEPGTELAVEQARILAIGATREGGWFVGTIRRDEEGPGRGEELPVVGVLPGVAVGRTYSMTLRYAPHPVHGPSWRLLGARLVLPRDRAGLAAFLQAQVEGVGRKRARLLFEAFGSGLAAVLDGDDAVERLVGVKGISRTVAEAVAACWWELRDQAEVDALLLEAGWSQLQIRRAHERFGDQLGQIIATAPYRLVAVRGVGFQLADRLALCAGAAAEDDGRVLAAAQHVAEEAARDGHCWT
ncbi:MAG: helix-hairpin-helix domain-containing protein, partial [Planctomycetota bacterium]